LIKRAVLFITVLVCWGAFFLHGVEPESEIRLPDANLFFRIEVKDEETGRGIPLVEVVTINKICYITDSAGLVAFYEPELMNRDLYFSFKSHGYEIKKDGFGFTGKTLKTIPGDSCIVEMKRKNIAERLYRITGSGIYKDSVLLGEKSPIEKPLVNAGVLGQDSTLAAIYKDKIFWVWGDTTHARYPLAANFKVTCATSLLPEKGGLDPEIGVNLEYFREKDFVKQMVPLPGSGNPYWLGCLVNVKDENGKECLVAHYSKIKPPLESIGRGLVRFNDEKEVFDEVCKYPITDIVKPNGHPFRVRDNGEEYLYFFAEGVYRTKADYESVKNHETYEAFTFMKKGSRFRASEDIIERKPNGNPEYSWKTNTSPIGEKQMQELVEKGILAKEEKWFGFVDADTGKDVQFAGGSIYWNNYRNRWVMIFNEIFGTSTLGEVWYAEGDTPLGPWYYARKIVTHEKYSFYNVVQHPHFAKEEGRVIFFEGTYTDFISGIEVPTPRYNYNQIMYKLDIGDERCAFPVAVYRAKGADFEYLTSDRISGDKNKAEIAFFALDRAFKDTAPIYESRSEKGTILQREKPGAESNRDFITAFYGLNTDSDETTTTAFLYEYTHRETLERFYSIGEDVPEKDYLRNPEPLCRVWKYPRKFNPWNLFNDSVR